MSLKKTAIICCLFAFTVSLHGQSFKKGNFVIGPMYQVQVVGKNPTFEKVYGLHASAFIADNWSLEYSISYAKVPFGVSYGKFYGGSVLSVFGVTQALNNFNSNGWWTLSLLSLLVPEGVSYHIPVNNQLTVSPFLNALSVDFYAPENSNSYWRMTNSAGVRLNMVVGNKLNIAPFAYGLVQYRGNSVGGSVGGYGGGVMARWVF